MWLRSVHVPDHVINSDQTGSHYDQYVICYVINLNNQLLNNYNISTITIIFYGTRLRSESAGVIGRSLVWSVSCMDDQRVTGHVYTQCQVNIWGGAVDAFGKKNTSLHGLIGKVNSVIAWVKYLVIRRKTKGCFLCLAEIRRMPVGCHYMAASGSLALLKKTRAQLWAPVSKRCCFLKLHFIFHCLYRLGSCIVRGYYRMHDSCVKAAHR